MLKRKAYKNLLEWKQQKGHGALLVTGARQIGKTYLLEEFARNEYEAYVKVDFVKDLEAKNRYAAVTDSGQAIDLLSLELGQPLTPGKTLIFFDEVQEAPEVLTLSKYLVQDGRFDLALSGSMLGTELSGIRSLPVGYLHILDMAPLSFEEFCWAQGVPDSILENVRSSFAGRLPLPDAVHDSLIKLFDRYLVVGGMPEAVCKSIEGARDLGSVRQVQDDLVRLYREDIIKYAKKRAPQIQAIFDALPSQLNKENKRFQLQSITKEAKYDRFANDFAWLVATCTALKVVNVTDPKPMLARTAEQNRFKLYSSDVGILMAQYPPSVAMASLLGEKSVNFGAVYENYVAQELSAAGVKLYYYHHSKRGEVDFLTETSEGKVLPIEVKSGKDYKLHTALSNLLSTAEYGIDEAIVLSRANVSVEKRREGDISYLPLYMGGLVAELGASRASAKSILENVHLDPIEW